MDILSTGKGRMDKSTKVLRVCSWNVNSLKSRWGQVFALLQEGSVDVMMLQEVKALSIDARLFHDSGYNIHYVGQKSYNGVAIASKCELEVGCSSLSSFEDEARYLECYDRKLDCSFICVYLPNGGSVDSASFERKLLFIQELDVLLSSKSDRRAVLGGDLNVSLGDLDVYDAQHSFGKLCFSPRELNLMRIIMQNWYDTFRLLHPNSRAFSWWDYRAMSYERNMGLRLDYIFANALMVRHLRSSHILQEYRKSEKPSDHAPVMCDFGL